MFGCRIIFWSVYLSKSCRKVVTSVTLFIEFIIQNIHIIYISVLQGESLKDNSVSPCRVNLVKLLNHVEIVNRGSFHYMTNSGHIKCLLTIIVPSSFVAELSIKVTSRDLSSFLKQKSLSSRCSFSMMAKWANDGKMLVNDCEMLVNDGEMSVISYNHFTVINEHFTIISLKYTIIRSFDHHGEAAPTAKLGWVLVILHFFL